MPEIHAERRLVKSPPELWAELSDLESLGRRLEEFGEIRITRLEPETAVAWEGDELRGTVELEASGWGTRVRLTVEAPESEGPEIEGLIEGPEAETLVEAREAAVLPEVDLDAVAPIPVAHPIAAEPAAGPEIPRQPGSVPPPSAPSSLPAPETPAAAMAPREPRGGFLRRLFRRRADTRSPARAPESGPATTPRAAAEAGARGPSGTLVPLGGRNVPFDTLAGIEGFGWGAGIPGRTPALAAPATAAPRSETVPVADPAEPAGPSPHQQVESVLAAVLDDLGAAHHRPFSRG